MVQTLYRTTGHKKINLCVKTKQSVVCYCPTPSTRHWAGMNRGSIAEATPPSISVETKCSYYPFKTSKVFIVERTPANIAIGVAVFVEPVLMNGYGVVGVSSLQTDASVGDQLMLWNKM